tara:strand:+ start:813 stop:1769 length:957 start_codon:yes stop_codon:yes gene_type:complete
MNKRQLLKGVSKNKSLQRQSLLKSELRAISDIPEHRICNSSVKSLYKFDSMDELMSMYDEHKENEDIYHNLAIGTISGREWTFGKLKGYNNKASVRDCIDKGKAHPKVMTYINKYRRELQEDGLYDVPDEMKSVKRKRRWSEDGGELDIDRVMTGDPNYWVTSSRDGKQRIVNIGVNYSMSSDNNSTQFPRLLAMAFCTAEIVERLGYGVEITGIRANYSTSGWNSSWERGFTFPLKKSQEPLDINRIGSISLVGFFRYYSFLIGNILYKDGCGRCTETSDDMTAFAGADIVVENKWLSNGKQEHYVKKALARIQEEV